MLTAHRARLNKLTHSHALTHTHDSHRRTTLTHARTRTHMHMHNHINQISTNLFSCTYHTLVPALTILVAVPSTSFYPQRSSNNHNDNNNNSHERNRNRNCTATATAPAPVTPIPIATTVPCSYTPHLRSSLLYSPVPCWLYCISHLIFFLLVDEG